MTIPQIKLGDAYLPLADGRIRDQFVLAEGPRGTGKTRAILSIIVLRALAHPGTRWLVARSTRTRLSQSVLTTLEDQVLPAFGMRAAGAAHAVNRVEYPLPNGSAIIPVGLDDQQRGQSVECAGVYLAECSELASIDDALALAGSMRQQVDSLGFVHQCILDINPVAPGFWANKVAEPVDPTLRRVASLADYQHILSHNAKPAPPGAWKRIITRHQDNPAYFDVRRWEWTDEGRTYLATLQHLQGHLRRRWLDGDWVAAQGSVFPEFDESLHVIKPFAVPSHWPCWWVHDAGMDHPAAWLLLTLAPDEQCFLIDEWYGGGRTIAQHAEWVTLHSAGRNVVCCYGDPKGCFQNRAEGPSVARQLGGYGITLRKHPEKRGVAVQNQVELLRRRLLDRTADGEPMLQVFDTCKGTIMEMQSWAYKRNSAGEMPDGDDAYEDRNNHAIDCLLGFFAMRKRHVQPMIEVWSGE